MVTRVGAITIVRAPNPSAMTLQGTNSYLIDVGGAELVCIDPGPAIPRHIDALLAQADSAKARIGLILITHGHPDHAPGASLLAEKTGAEVAVHPKSDVPHTQTVRDEQSFEFANTTIVALDAPGHTFEHLVFYDTHERALFTGDVVLGEGTVVIAPPAGAMRPYQATLHRLRDEFAQATRIFGGHGPVVNDPCAKLDEYIAHRQMRERELLETLARGPQTIPQLVTHIYRNVAPLLWPAAARQLLAYLIALESEGRVHSSALPRALTAQEHTILNPQWESIVGKENAAVIEAELGATLRLDQVRVYELGGVMRKTTFPN